MNLDSEARDLKLDQHDNLYSKSEPERGSLDTSVETCAIRPESTLQFRIPIWAVVGDDFLLDILQCLVRRLY